MKEQCIFRCYSDGKTYRVVVRPNDKTSRGVEYLTYVGRRRLEQWGWSSKEYAISSVLEEALGNLLWITIKEMP